ncbi:MAG: type II toxin-antitoxin system YafQ family toxin [archaeon]|nr:type II toxin-antitoxin system YafQ family toxin [archaeon]
MYEIRLTKSFRKSFKRIVNSGQERGIKEEMTIILGIIAKKQNLPKKYKDHALTGEYKTYRECHFRPDLLFIYKINKEERVVYALNVGSHSDLFS